MDNTSVEQPLIDNEIKAPGMIERIIGQVKAFKEAHPILFWVIFFIAIAVVAALIALLVWAIRKIFKRDKRNSKEGFTMVAVKDDNDYVDSIINSIYGNGKGLISGGEATKQQMKDGIVSNLIDSNSYGEVGISSDEAESPDGVVIGMDKAGNTILEYTTITYDPSKAKPFLDEEGNQVLDDDGNVMMDPGQGTVTVHRIYEDGKPIPDNTTIYKSITEDPDTGDITYEVLNADGTTTLVVEPAAK